MGSMISSFFRTGGHLLSSGTSETTRNTVLALLQDMREKEMSHIEWCSIETYISNIPKVLYHYIMLIIRKEELLNDEEQTFTKLIWLYYYAMNHKELYKCFKILNTQTTLIPMGSAVASLLRYMRTHPRSLKQITRVAIYNAMNNRVAPNINKLPLPAPLKEYLLDWIP